jgi:uncharacterized membrane protein (UPF0182 family)
LVYQMPDRACRRTSARHGRVLLLAVAVAVLLGAAAVAGLRLWADWRWYREAGYGSVFAVRLCARLALFAAFGVLGALAVAGNAWLAHRLRPPLSAMSAEQRALEPARAMIARHRRRALLAPSAAVGVAAGATASTAWSSCLQWLDATPFGVRDPQFHLDVAFYTFELPWYRFLVGFGFSWVLVGLLTAGLAHYLFGGLSLRGPGRRTTDAAQLHLAVLLAAFTALKAVAYWLDRYQMAVSPGSVHAVPGWTGPAYVDVTADLPARAVLAAAAVICVLLFASVPLRRDWRPPLVGLGLLGLCSLLVCGLYPALVQHLQSGRREQAEEAPYLARGLTATQAAYGIAGTRTATPAPAGADAAAALVEHRVAEVAPFLALDDAAYPVRMGAGRVWVVDGYTTSDSYPYSSRTRLRAGGRELNYIRNAVKATVDESTGRVTLYQWDTGDPVLRTWMKAFPGTVQPYGLIPAGLVGQLRSPSELAAVQQAVWGQCRRLAA